jgi:hypothetical protein
VLLLDSKTSVPPSGAAALKVTVQVVAVPEVILLGLQANCETGSACPNALMDNERTPSAATVRLPYRLEFRIVLMKVLCRLKLCFYCDIRVFVFQDCKSME